MLIRPRPAAALQTFAQRLSATPRGARLARRLTRYHLDVWGIAYDSALSADAEAVVAELAANAVTHGRVPGRDFELGLTLRVDTLRVEVADARGESVPRVAPASPAPGEESGRGLLVVAALAVEWGVAGRQVGKTVWADLAVPSRPR